MLGDLPAPVSEKTLSLSQEEAFALLEMCTLTLAKDGPNHLRVLCRLSNLCREMLTPAAPDEPIAIEPRAPILSSSPSGGLLTIACLC
jgi:hypothetical protein